jgi:hypothetical protein
MLSYAVPGALSDRNAFPNFSSAINPSPIGQSASSTGYLRCHCLTIEPNTSEIDSLSAPLSP